MITDNNILTKIRSLRQKIIISPIQFFIVCFIIALVFFVIKYIGLKTEWKIARIEVTGKPWYEDYSNATGLRPPSWLIGKIKRGDTVYGYDGKKIAEILNVEEYSDVKPNIFILAKLQVLYNKNSQKYAFQNNLIDNGTPIELNLPHGKISGQIIEFNADREYKSKNIIVHGRVRYAETWLQDIIQKGDKMMNLADETVTAEILDKTIDPTAGSVFFLNPNYFTDTFIDKNPRLKDVVLNLRIKIIDYPEGWRFAGNQIIKVGNLLKLSFSNYELPIVEIQDFRDE